MSPGGCKLRARPCLLLPPPITSPIRTTPVAPSLHPHEEIPRDRRPGNGSRARPAVGRGPHPAILTPSGGVHESGGASRWGPARMARRDGSWPGARLHPHGSPKTIPLTRPPTPPRAPMPRQTLLLTAAASFLVLPARAAEPAPAFNADVRPILQAYCTECHGEAEKPKGGLDLRLRRFALRGGKSGPAVVAGKPDESLLVERVSSGEMPPGKKKLSAAEIDVL